MSERTCEATKSYIGQDRAEISAKDLEAKRRRGKGTTVHMEDGTMSCCVFIALPLILSDPRICRRIDGKLPKSHLHKREARNLVRVR